MNSIKDLLNFAVSNAIQAEQGCALSPSMDFTDMLLMSLMDAPAAQMPYSPFVQANDAQLFSAVLGALTARAGSPSDFAQSQPAQPQGRQDTAPRKTTVHPTPDQVRRKVAAFEAQANPQLWQGRLDKAQADLDNVVNAGITSGPAFEAAEARRDALQHRVDEHKEALELAQVGREALEDGEIDADEATILNLELDEVGQAGKNAKAELAEAFELDDAASAQIKSKGKAGVMRNVENYEALWQGEQPNDAEAAATWNGDQPAAAESAAKGKRSKKSKMRKKTKNALKKAVVTKAVVDDKGKVESMQTKVELSAAAENRTEVEKVASNGDAHAQLDRLEDQVDNLDKQVQGAAVKQVKADADTVKGTMNMTRWAAKMERAQQDLDAVVQAGIKKGPAYDAAQLRVAAAEAMVKAESQKSDFVDGAADALKDGRISGPESEQHRQGAESIADTQNNAERLIAQARHTDRLARAQLSAEGAEHALRPFSEFNDDMWNANVDEEEDQMAAEMARERKANPKQKSDRSWAVIRHTR